jgi:hypothetical protein
MHNPQPKPLNEEANLSLQLEEGIAARVHIIDSARPRALRLRTNRLRTVAQVELFFWTLGIGVAITLNALSFQRGTPYSFFYVLLLSLYTLPNSVLILALLGVGLIYLTFSVAPITILLGVIRPHLWRLVSIGPQTEELDEETTIRPAPSKVNDIQSVMLSRSRGVARAASTRPQVLLFIGALIAVGGLVFFVVTLPQEVNPLTQLPHFEFEHLL